VLLVLAALCLPAILLISAVHSTSAAVSEPPPSSAATARPKLPLPPANLQYGFVMALLGNNSTVRSMGFQWVSYGIYWSDSEPSPGTYDWGNVNNIINGAQSAGVNVLVRVARPPVWARDPACSSVDTCPPSNPSDFGNFTHALAAHVRNDLNPTVRVAYEIWNEPNVDNEWGNMCPDPARYTSLLRAAYPAIKSADASATVVAGAITTVGEVRAQLNCHMDDILYLQGMYSAGAAPYFDVLSDHPYGFVSEPEADPMTTSPPLVFRRAERHRQIMVDSGDSGKQIWATEMGWAIDPATEGLPCSRPDWF
jgi:hypothetical protein